jgi:uncharacterized protein involved in exopolysaccharide biosynthesis
VNNPVVQQLLVQQALKTAQLKELSEKTGNNHPQYIAAKAELDEINRQLDVARDRYLASMNTMSKSVTSKKGALNSALNEQKDKLFALKEVKGKISLLLRNVDNAQRAYDLAMQRFTQTALESQARQTNVVVLQKASIPTRATSPNIMLNAAFGFVMGLLLALLAAFIAEFLNRKIRVEKDIEDVLGCPVLASLKL